MYKVRAGRAQRNTTGGAPTTWVGMSVPSAYDRSGDPAEVGRSGEVEQEVQLAVRLDAPFDRPGEREDRAARLDPDRAVEGELLADQPPRRLVQEGAAGPG